jgi:hypothetical protein
MESFACASRHTRVADEASLSALFERSLLEQAGLSSDGKAGCWMRHLDLSNR